MTTPEGKIKEIVKKCLKKLQDRGFSVYRFMPVQNGMGAPALDFYVCIEGLFVAIETKAPGKTLTARQFKTSEAIAAAGGYVIVARCWEDIEYGLSFVCKEAAHRKAREKAWGDGKIIQIGR